MKPLSHIPVVTPKAEPVSFYVKVDEDSPRLPNGSTRSQSPSSVAPYRTPSSRRHRPKFVAELAAVIQEEFTCRRTFRSGFTDKYETLKVLLRKKFMLEDIELLAELVAKTVIEANNLCTVSRVTHIAPRP